MPWFIIEHVWKHFRIIGALIFILLLVVSNPGAAEVTLSPTPTPDEGLIDNFDNDGSLMSSPGQRDGYWYSVTTTPGTTCALEIKPDAGGNSYLSIAFGAFNNGDYIAVKGLSRPGKKTNFSRTRLITFDQNNIGMKLAIKFQDVNGLKTASTGFSALAYSDNHCSLDLAALNWSRCDSRYIEQILVFPASEFPNINLNFSMDDLHAADYDSGLAPPAGLIDNFDNDGVLTATSWERDARWWGSGEGIYTLETTAGIGGNNTPCLHVRYSKPAGEEWSFITAGDLIFPSKCQEFPTAQSISLRVYGSIALMLKFQDNSLHESSDTEMLSVSDYSGWTTLTYNLAGFDWKQCDNTRIQTVLFFVRPGKIGSGEFWLDDLELSTRAPSPTPGPASSEGCATPNPFLPTAGQKAKFNISAASNFEIRIMNIRGTKVRTLRNTAEWDGRDEGGNWCKGGLYIYQIDAPDQRLSGKVVLIK